jgi:hypothetical protein
VDSKRDRLQQLLMTGAEIFVENKQTKFERNKTTVRTEFEKNGKTADAYVLLHMSILNFKKCLL